MAKRKSLLISLFLAFFACMAMFFSTLFTSKQADAATYTLNVVSNSLNQNYLSHWQNGQNSYGYGESGTNGGTWAVGYGDVIDSGTVNGADTYSFTALTKNTTEDANDKARYSYTYAHKMQWGHELLTRNYTYNPTQTLLTWTAKGNGHVSFNGLFSKANTDKGTLAKTQNGLSENLNIPGSFASCNWVNGDSYTISISVVKPIGHNGNPSVVTIASATYTSEYVYLVPESDIWVEANDVVVFGLKCNTLSSGQSEWDTNTMFLLDATFTEEQLPGTYKQLYSVTGGTAWSSYNHYFSRSIVAGEGPFNWVEKSNFLTGHSSTIYMNLPVTTWKDSFASYALWVELPATTSDLVFTPKYYDGSVGQTRTLTKGTLVHAFDESGTYKNFYVDANTINMGKTGFKGWIVFPIEFARANIVDPSDYFTFEFAAGAPSVNNIKFGGFGVFYDMAEFLYAYAPLAADTYYSNMIDTYVTKTNALTASSTFQTEKKAEIVSWLNGLKSGMSAQTNAEKIVWTKTLNEDYINELAEYQAQFVLEGDPINSIFITSDTHMTASADGKTLMTSALRDMTALQKEKNVNAIALMNLGDLSQWGLDADYAITGDYNDLDDYYTWTASNYLSDLSGNRVPYLNVLGNHDVRGNIDVVQEANYTKAADYYKATDEILKASTSKSSNGMNFSYQINGYTFIMLNTAEYQWDNCMLYENDLVWLESELEKVEEGKPCFILVHQPVHLIYSTRDGSSVSGYGFQDIINKFSNVVVLSGHAHDSFGTDKALIQYAESGSVYVNMPSLYYNYYTPYNNEYGDGVCQYYYMEIYENGIVLKGRDFGIDKYVPEATVAFARTSTVAFEDYDGTAIDSKTYEWGATPIAPANPSRPATSTMTYTFNGWDSAVSTVKGAKVYTATYTETPITYAVTVTNDTNKGDITGVATQSYNAGTALNITITPKLGYEIKSVTWNGNSETVTATGMTLNKTVNSICTLVVEYEATVNTYNLTITNNNAQGTVSGVTAGEYADGTSFNITVTPETGYKISSVTWGSDSITVSNALGFSFSKTVTAETELIVAYEKIDYEVTIIAPDATISGGNTYQVAHGETLTFTVTPTVNYQITSILVNGVESISTVLSGNTVTIQNVTSETTIEIACEMPSYTVTVNVQNGSVNGLNSLQIVHGQNSSFNITPTIGYEFSYAEVNGVRNDAIFSAGSSYDVVTINGVTQETTINVYYVIKTFQVSISVTGATVTGNATATVNYGESATFTVTPTAGYELYSLTVNGADNLSAYDSGSVTITNITSTTAIVVVFTDPYVAPTEYTVTLQATGATINGNATISVIEGNSAIFTVTPNTNYILTSLTVNGVDSLSAYNNGIITVENITADTEIVITFTSTSGEPSEPSDPVIPEPPVTTYKVTLKYDKTMGVVDGIANGNYEKGKIDVTITAFDGYKIKSVTVNGKEIEIEDDTLLTFELNITKKTTVEIEFEGGEGGMACLNSLNTVAPVGVALLVFASAMLIVKSKKEN
ncbi:MAG: metallophosphoesterase [Clostridia bacterium]|nr:metallophosphoesterase [Clostridia bacterium]